MFLPRISPQRSRHPTTCTEHQLITPPSRTSLSGPHHERVAGPRCTVVASCSIGGCDPSSVTTASLLCCAVHVCVCCLSRVSRKIRTWIFGNMVKWSRCPILDLLAGVPASQSSCLLFFPTFFSNLFLHDVHVTQTPQTTDRTRAVQGACYNQLATTLYTPAVYQQSRKQTPHACGSLSRAVLLLWLPI